MLTVFASKMGQGESSPKEEGAAPSTTPPSKTPDAPQPTFGPIRWFDLSRATESLMTTLGRVGDALAKKNLGL